MTRDADPATLSAAQSAVVYLAALVELDVLPTPLRMWTGLGDLVWQAKVFTGVGNVLSISAIEETVETRATGLTLQLAGLPPDQIDAARDAFELSRWQGRAARIWLGFFDSSWRLVGEPMRIASGQMDVLEQQENETVQMTLTVESVLVNLERSRPRRYTDVDQQAEYPGDRAFEYVASVQELELPWGQPATS